MESLQVWVRLEGSRNVARWEGSFHTRGRGGGGDGPWQLHLIPQGPPVRARSADSGEDSVALPPSTMLEFAQKYFRDPRRRLRWVVIRLPLPLLCLELVQAVGCWLPAPLLQRGSGSPLLSDSGCLPASRLTGRGRDVVKGWDARLSSLIHLFQGWPQAEV